MTREKAFELAIQACKETWNEKTCAEIIKALEQESCGDIISRREAIKKFTYNYKGQRIPDYDCDNWPTQIDLIKVRKYLRELPPVISQPKEKTGHWIILDDCEHFIAKCSECGEVEDSRMIIMYPYCHCGAKMVEPQEISDHKCHNCKHYTSGDRDGSCGSYICKHYSGWESEK